jgi:COP9 signalosome complex subunit 1
MMAGLVVQQERLEGDLTAYKANLVKESIRMGHNDLGDFFYAAGDLQA